MGEHLETVNGWTQKEARSAKVDTPDCVYCKQDTDDPAVTTVSLETGEVICETCLQDLREFKRYRYVDIIYDMGLGPTTRRIVLDYWQSVQAEIENVCEDDPDVFPLPQRISNANQYEQADSYGVDPGAE